jgi:acyl-CoA carboxylase epsilon subunit
VVAVSGHAESDRAGRPPVLRVIHGDATPEEIAAVVAVLLARSAAASALAAASSAATPSAWADPSRQLRRPLFPGPDAWRRSALPG